MPLMKNPQYLIKATVTAHSAVGFRRNGRLVHIREFVDPASAREFRMAKSAQIRAIPLNPLTFPPNFKSQI